MADISELKNKSAQTGADDTGPTSEIGELVKTNALGLIDDSLLSPSASSTETTPVAGADPVLSLVTDKTATATWGVATDVGGTQQTSLKYRVCLSTTAVVDINDAMNRDSWQSRWSRDLTTIDLHGLFYGTNYFVTVFVKNWDENIAMYTSTMFTAAAVDPDTYYVDPTAVAGVGLGVFATGELETVAGLTLGTNIFNTLFDALTQSEADMTATGTTIYLSNGTHDVSAAAPSVLITFPTHIIGLGKKRTELFNGGGIPAIVPPDHASGGRSAMIVSNDTDLTVANLELNGDGFTGLIRYGIWAAATNTVVANCVIHSISLGNYSGEGLQHSTVTLAKRHISTLSAQNNIFHNNGRVNIIGLNSAANGAVVRWNTIYGQGPLQTEKSHIQGRDDTDGFSFNGITSYGHTEGKGDYLNQGIEFASTEGTLIVENEFNDLKGIAVGGGGSSSSAIYVYNWGANFGGFYDNPLTSATILYNDINRCTRTISAGLANIPDFGPGGPSTNNCDITAHGNVSKGIQWPYQRNVVGLFDVTNNYWGDVNIEKSIIGDQIFGDADVQIYPVAKSDKIETI